MQHVLRGGFRMCLIGIVVGVIAASQLGHLLSGVLFGVEAGDPVTFVVTGGVLLLIAMIACWLPARRATRIDPALALRGD
jgi:ABC-type antimicrobial peptide transport system permease subunit